VRTALNLELEANAREDIPASSPPLSDAQFRKFLNKVCILFFCFF
jgi:hypothetical protein